MSSGKGDGSERRSGRGRIPPPNATRFAKGRSGNPRGRPKGSRREAPYEAVLGQTVTIRDGGVERQVSASEAFLLNLVKQGLEGNSFATSVLAKVFEEAKASTIVSEDRIDTIVVQLVAPGSVVPALEPLRMAKMLDGYRATARILLEPWIVEAALERLGNRRLTLDEQATVLAATRQPHKVSWPQWWGVRSAQN